MNSNNQNVLLSSKQNQDNIRIFALKIAEIQSKYRCFEDAKPEIKEMILMLKTNFFDFYTLNLPILCRSRSLRKCIKELDDEFFRNFLEDIVKIQTSGGSSEVVKEEIKDMLFRFNLEFPNIYNDNYGVLSTSLPLSTYIKELEEENNYLLEALAVEN